MKVCSVLDCGSPSRCSELCSKHYQRETAKRAKVNLCACGCGELTRYTFSAGHQTRFLSPEEQARRGRMNTGDKQRDRGSGKSYRKVRGRHEHRIVMEQLLGRKLLPGEIVHHKNDCKRDNSPGNLQVMTQSEHMKIHLPEMLAARKLKLGQR